MQYTIYQITNLINNKIYIGQHQTLNIHDSYYGSGNAILASIKKYNKSNFKKDILFIFNSKKDMNLKEIELVNSDFVSRCDTYNIALGGAGGAFFTGLHHTPESILKIKASLSSDLNKSILIAAGRKVGLMSKGLKLSAHGIENIRIGALNRWSATSFTGHTIETRLKISKSLILFNINNPDFHKNRSKKNPGHPISDIAKEKISIKQLGRHRIHNIELNLERNPHIEEPIPLGWQLGRLPVIHITNGITNKNLGIGQPIPEGFYKGWIKK